MHPRRKKILIADSTSQIDHFPPTCAEHRKAHSVAGLASIPARRAQSRPRPRPTQLADAGDSTRYIHSLSGRRCPPAKAALHTRPSLERQTGRNRGYAPRIPRQARVHLTTCIRRCTTPHPHSTRRICREGKGAKRPSGSGVDRA